MILRPAWTPGVTQCNCGCNADRKASLYTHLKGEERKKAREGNQSRTLYCCPNSLFQLFLRLCSPLTSSCYPKFKRWAPPSHATCLPGAHDFPEVATFALTLLLHQPVQPRHVCCSRNGNCVYGSRTQSAQSQPRKCCAGCSATHPGRSYLEWALL